MPKKKVVKKDEECKTIDCQTGNSTTNALLAIVIVLLVAVIALFLIYSLTSVFDADETTNTNVNTNANLNLNENLNLNKNANLNANSNLNENLNLNLNENTNLNQNTNTPAKTGSEIIGVDSTWNQYRNYDFGYSINIPKMAYELRVGCDTNTNGYSSTSHGATDVVVLDDEYDVYISQKIFPDLTGGTTVNGVTTNYTSCAVEDTAVSDIEGSNGWLIGNWKLTYRDVYSENDIEYFYQNKNPQYPNTCTVAKLTELEGQPGVYGVAFNTTGPEGGCFINGMEITNYYPAENKLVHWGIGQAFTFVDASSNNYDEAMRDSFRFL